MPPLKPEFDLSKALEYIEKFLPKRPKLATDGSDLKDVNINPTLGTLPLTLAEFLIASKHPKKILEIGTSVAETAVALGRIAATYGGRIVTIEINRRIASAAVQNIQHTGVEKNVELIVGDANEIIEHQKGPFGLIIQDGTKSQYITMLDRLIELLEPGGILLSDDILFPVMFDDPKAMTLDPYNHALELDPRLKTVWLPIGDGVALSTKIY